MKIVFGDPKSKFVFQKEIDAAKEAQFMGKKIGDKFDGSIIGLEGYELTITGGSDKSGFPMRQDIVGVRKILAFLSGGAGIRKVAKGSREKRNVVGNSITETIAQVNAKITKDGSKSLADCGFVPASEEDRKKKKEEKKAAAKSGKAKGKPKR